MDTQHGDSLFEDIKPFLKKGMRVLDVGCFEFEYSTKLRDLGCEVIAIDKRLPHSPTPVGITFIHTDFADFVPSGKIDVLFMSYVVPFIEPKLFFKKLETDFPNVQIVAVRAFTDYPEPRFDADIHLYQEADFKKLPFEPSVLATWDDTHADMRGNIRDWHIIEYIGVRP